MSGSVSPDDLRNVVAALAEALSPSDVFRVLLDGSRLGAPRASVLLLRQGVLKGWGSRGYTAEAAPKLREFAERAAESWLTRLLGDADLGHDERRPGESGPEFGQPPAAEAVAVAVRVARRPVALLVAERNAGQEPWSLPTLETLALVAQIRLELDLAHRKFKKTLEGQEKPAARLAAPVAASTAANEAPSPAPAAPAAATLAPAPGPAATALAPAEEEAAIDDAAAENAPAMRYAKLIATDIRLYNEDAVVAGRQNGDLAARLGEHLKRGRDTFVRRYGELGAEGLDILHEAFVQVLAAGDHELLPSSKY
jgi:hypothetical protein